MKYIIEDKDLKEVQWIAKDYYGIILNDDQTRDLIVESSHIRQELDGGGLSDTSARSMLADTILEKVMKDEDPPTNKTEWGAGWSWPIYADSKKYSAEFKLKFSAACAEKGYTLEDKWSEGW